MNLELNKIYQGAALDILQSFPSKSVNCCVTSPPYWGLRDYGTAEWEGGDLDCSHKVGRFTSSHSEKQGSNAGSGDKQAKDICPKCGAKRIDNQIGLEKTPEEYVNRLVNIFSEVKRVLKDGGTLWLNLGDSYVSAKSRFSSKPQTVSGKNRGEPVDNNKPDLRKHNYLKDKDLAGIPWHVAFALQRDGWYLRNDIIWHKPNPMPESVTDRCTKSHEHIFLLSKSKKYYFDNEAIKEPSIDKESYTGRRFRGAKEIYKQDGIPNHMNHQTFNKGSNELVGKKYPTRNKRDVWKITTKSFPEAHFAVYPPDLIRPCIKAGCPDNGIVLDPFIGAGTTAQVAIQENKNFVGIELNQEYIDIANKRLGKVDKSYYDELPENKKPKQTQLF